MLKRLALQLIQIGITVTAVFFTFEAPLTLWAVVLFIVVMVLVTTKSIPNVLGASSVVYQNILTTSAGGGLKACSLNIGDWTEVCVADCAVDIVQIKLDRSKDLILILIGAIFVRDPSPFSYFTAYLTL